MSDIVEKVQKAVGDTPLMVPGTLRDLLCCGAYANNHVISLLLRDVAVNAIRAVLDAIASDGELIIGVARQRARDEGYDPDFMMRDLTGPEYAAWTTFVDDVRDVFAALRKEIEDV